LTLSLILFSLRIYQKQEVMELYWGEKKNSVTDWRLFGIDFDPALVPCCIVECDLWRDRECIRIRKTGKPDRPRIFSRHDSCMGDPIKRRREPDRYGKIESALFFLSGAYRGSWYQETRF
jgi:hypothetical protein